jgi:hypothetical protein
VLAGFNTASPSRCRTTARTSATASETWTLPSLKGPGRGTGQPASLLLLRAAVSACCSGPLLACGVACVNKPLSLILYACRQRQEREREQQLEEGENCQLVVRLPDGSEHTHSFKLGVTVAWVKHFICQQYGVPQEKQLLQTGGRTLIDPCTCSIGTQCMRPKPAPAFRSCSPAAAGDLFEPETFQLPPVMLQPCLLPCFVTVCSVAGRLPWHHA